MSAKKIIVGYDRSDGAGLAARWALDEAARTGAPVEFFYAYEWPTWTPAASMVPATTVWPDGETERAIRDMLHDAVLAAGKTHPDVHAAMSVAHAPAALTLIERSADASLIVLGCQGHSGVADLLGSVSAAVSAHAHCPVIVVRGDPATTDPIVAGVDDSPAAGLVLAFAFRRAAERGTDLHVLRAWRGAVGTAFDERPLVTEAMLNAEAQRLDDEVAPWRRKYPQVKVTTELVREHPAAALTAAAAHAGLVVVGSRGRGAFRGLVLGSVSRHLLHHSVATVAVVREMSDA